MEPIALGWIVGCGSIPAAFFVSLGVFIAVPDGIRTATEAGTNPPGVLPNLEGKVLMVWSR